MSLSSLSVYFMAAPSWTDKLPFTLELSLILYKSLSQSINSSLSSLSYEFSVLLRCGYWLISFSRLKKGGWSELQGSKHPFIRHFILSIWDQNAALKSGAPVTQWHSATSQTKTSNAPLWKLTTCKSTAYSFKWQNINAPQSYGHSILFVV